MPACTVVPFQHVLDIERHHADGDAQRRAVDHEDEQQPPEARVFQRRQEVVEHRGAALARDRQVHQVGDHDGSAETDDRDRDEQQAERAVALDLGELPQAVDRSLRRGDRRSVGRRPGGGQRRARRMQRFGDVAVEAGTDQDRRQHDGQCHAGEPEYFARHGDARSLVVVVGEIRAMRVIADRHAGIAEMHQDQRHQQPDGKAGRPQHVLGWRMEEHEDSADQEGHGQQHEEKPPAWPMGHAVADEAQQRILQCIQHAGEQQVGAQRRERQAQRIAIEFRHIEHDGQRSHVERQLQRRVGDQSIERQLHVRRRIRRPGGGELQGEPSCLFRWSRLWGVAGVEPSVSYA